MLASGRLEAGHGKAMSPKRLETEKTRSEQRKGSDQTERSGDPETKTSRDPDSRETQGPRETEGHRETETQKRRGNLGVNTHTSSRVKAQVGKQSRDGCYMSSRCA